MGHPVREQAPDQPDAGPPHPRPAENEAARSPLAAAGAPVILGLARRLVWIEPRLLLLQDARADRPRGSPVRVAHLSDLHIRGDTPLLHRSWTRSPARPAGRVIVISGDLIQDVPGAREIKDAAAVTAFVAGLRRTAPVYAVQGHSEHQGEVVGGLEAAAGLDWLSNEGRRIGPGRQPPAPGAQHAGGRRRASPGHGPSRSGRWRGMAPASTAPGGASPTGTSTATTIPATRPAGLDDMEALSPGAATR